MGNCAQKNVETRCGDAIMVKKCSCALQAMAAARAWCRGYVCAKATAATGHLTVISANPSPGPDRSRRKSQAQRRIKAGRLAPAPALANRGASRATKRPSCSIWRQHAVCCAEAEAACHDVSIWQQSRSNIMPEGRRMAPRNIIARRRAIGERRPKQREDRRAYYSESATLGAL